MRNIFISIGLMLLTLCCLYLFYKESDFYLTRVMENKSWHKQIDLILPPSSLTIDDAPLVKESMAPQHVLILGRIRFLSNGTYLRSYDISLRNSGIENGKQTEQIKWPEVKDKGVWNIQDNYLVLSSHGFKNSHSLSNIQEKNVEKILANLGVGNEQILRVHLIDAQTILLVGLDSLSRVLVSR